MKRHTITTQKQTAKHNSLEKWQLKQDEANKQKRRFDFWSSTCFIVAMLLLVWSIKIYRVTFIDWRILVAPVTVGGILVTTAFWRKLTKFNYPVWATLLIGFGIGGSIVYFCFLFPNEKFASINQITEDFSIEKTGRLASGRRGCGEPYAVINFYGLSKDVLFGCNDIGRITDAMKVRIIYSEGWFGYAIIRKKSLEK